LLIIAVTLLGGALAQAASYQTTDGSIVDPIINSYTNSPHSYSRNNLAPLADLAYADLTHVDLYRANLTDAVLTNASLLVADLTDADLYRANLTDAVLTNASLLVANLTDAILYRANLTDANLTNAILTDATFSAGTILPSGLTAMQHGFDAAGLQAYLEGAPIFAGNADIQLVLFLLLGDANNDNQVTGADLVIVQQNFGNVDPNMPTDGLFIGDANDDGKVTGADLIVVQQNFGNTLAPVGAEVPEPTSACLLTLASLGAMVRRRRVAN